MPKTKDGRKLRFNDLSNPWQRFRSQTGLSQLELATALGLGQPSISAYEAGGFPEPIYAKRLVELAQKKKIRMSMDEVYEGLPT